MKVTVIWDVTLCSLVGVLMRMRNMLPTGFSETLARFYMAFYPRRWTPLQSPLAGIFVVQNSNVIS
jgi:hypothetical protein